MKFWLPLLLMGLALCRPLIAQKTSLSDKLWAPQNEQLLPVPPEQQPVRPNAFRVFQLDSDILSSLLEAAPLWQTEAANRQASVISLPLPDGSLEDFNVLQAPVMHPGLARKFPGIKTYVGKGVQDPTAYLRFDVTPGGLHAMILSGKKGAVFIDPYSTDGAGLYIVYFKKDAQPTAAWHCGFEAPAATAPDGLEAPAGDREGGCTLRTYRLALACTGEYAQYHGGTVEAALSAMVTTMTRVNGIFERDASITLQLVENNDLLIFTNPNTDPYHNFSGSKMLDENQSTCDDLIGSANYDIGHVFSTGGGGIAYLKAVCNSAIKAGGVTGKSVPIGDAFDVDYVCHEMAHQFGANHTHNNNCNRNAATSVEPGSGSTIMGYAGVCPPNVQWNSDAYFHAISLAEIASYLNGNGGSCASQTQVNSAPAPHPVSNFTIPKSTGFVLSGSADDPDGDENLTYCWEQMDNEAAVMPPVPSNPVGHAFRSMPPSAAGERYFPSLEAIITGRNAEWETLPNTGRVLNFRLTVRDNHPGGGCSAFEDAIVTVDGGAGPFVVSTPNTPVVWEAGSQQTVTWSVAGSDHAPVNCAKVDISLSLDGGYTYPVVLASAVPNDGAHIVTVPNAITSRARIMVKGAGHIFFDISDSDFTIAPSTQFFVSVTTENPGCFGDKTGTARANPSGGIGSYFYKWSNGETTPLIGHLQAGTYSVTVTSGVQVATASFTISQPEKLQVEVSGLDASAGPNGMASAIASGGTPDFSYTWNTGSASTVIEHLPAGDYIVTVTDANGCEARGEVTLSGQPPVKFEYGTLENVTNKWQKVLLKNSYDSMVVAATVVVEGGSTPSLVTRIRKAQGNSFELKLQEAGTINEPVGEVRVFFMVAEEGVYTDEENGVKFEAIRCTSTQTSRAGDWIFEPRNYANEYKSPVVIGQVMSYNDPHWSVFWASSADKRREAPIPAGLSVGKQVGEDDGAGRRNSEAIGYFVFEKGMGFINGKKFLAMTGASEVQGPDDSAFGFAYPFGGFTKVEAALVAPAGIKGDEGAWPVLKSPSPTSNALLLYMLEDQIRDKERSHPGEQVAYVVFGEGPSPDPVDEPGDPIVQDDKPDPASFITAYPNPATNTVTVEFYQTLPGGPTMLLCDALGRCRFEQTLVIGEPGYRKAMLDLSGLEAGYYTIKVAEGSRRKLIKLVRL
ncbi:MAG: hypothetical protein H6577_12210 [Lewinellaceae bacterium]|nr:hypothetical protein [Lewinellaceae bacterium]